MVVLEEEEPAARMTCRSLGAEGGISGAGVLELLLHLLAREALEVLTVDLFCAARGHQEEQSQEQRLHFNLKMDSKIDLSAWRDLYPFCGPTGKELSWTLM